MDGIFISYRRRDRPLATSLLVNKLEERYGAKQVFHDLDDIDAGENFIERIHSALDSCSVLLAVIGPDWLKHHKKRLHRPDDPVRMEIGTALAKQVLVIPIVLSNTRMPEPEDLPDELKEFHYKNASRIRSTDLDADIAKLIERLDRIPLLATAAKIHSGSLQGEDTRQKPAALAGAQSATCDHDTLDFVTTPVTRAIPRFSLYAEEDQTSLQFKGPVVALNRDSLDPGNFSISSKTHARFEYSNGNWNLTDMSSNNATFVAIDGAEVVRDSDWLVFGTEVFQFESVIGHSVSDFDAEETFSLAELNKSTFYLRAQFHLQQHGGNKLTFYGDEVVVNRESLDQDNPSISRKKHARFDLRNGAWYVTDLSSNNASFVQLRNTTPIVDGTALVFGRKVFTFHCRR
ncbi:MAG: TIR domain-containing protein [Pseudomonadales bacterium]